MLRAGRPPSDVAAVVRREARAEELRAAAEAKWREVSEQNRGRATVRFGIACEATS